MEDVDRTSFREWLFRVFGLAAVSFFLGLAAALVRQPDYLEITEIAIGLLFSFVWVVNLTVAFFVLRLRSSWLLLPAPMALFLPYQIGGIFYSCAHGVCL
jgi:hypothetical protein